MKYDSEQRMRSNDLSTLKVESQKSWRASVIIKSWSLLEKPPACAIVNSVDLDCTSCCKRVFCMYLVIYLTYKIIDVNTNNIDDTFVQRYWREKRATNQKLYQGIRFQIYGGIVAITAWFCRVSLHLPYRYIEIISWNTDSPRMETSRRWRFSSSADFSSPLATCFRSAHFEKRLNKPNYLPIAYKTYCKGK